MASRLTQLFLICLTIFLQSADHGIAEGLPSSSGDVQRPALSMGLNVAGFTTLDPHQAAASGDRIVVDMVFSGLIRFKPGLAPALEPDLAEAIPEPEIEAGVQTWTFRLREGVAFHTPQGVPYHELTAADVIRSFEKAMDPQRSSCAGAYDGIKVTALDERTVRFNVDPPQSPLLFLPKVANYAGGFIVHERTGPGPDGLPALSGTGPFFFAGRDTDNTLFLKSHDGYFRGKPRLAGIRVHYLPDPAIRLQEFLRGLDLICGESASDWIKRIPKSETVLIDRLGVPETANIHFNTAKPPFDDIRVRKAVAYALDRDGFTKPFGADLARKVFSPAPPHMPGGLDEHQVRALGLDYSTDTQKARQLLADAGYPDGFRFEVIASEMNQYLENYFTLKEQLAGINIDMTVHVRDHASMHKAIRKDANPLVIYEAFRPNTDEFLSRFFHSESIVVTGTKPETNFSHTSVIDELIEKARRERITSKQIKLWEYAQIKLLEDMVVYPLHYRNHTYVRKSNLDYGHPVVNAIALYPQITERTALLTAEEPRP